MNKKDLIQAMKDIDVCMMSTLSKDGKIRSRPMSNNGNLEENGTTYFFSNEKTHKVDNLESNTQCSLTYQKDKDVFIELFGKTNMTQDKDKMKKYWSEALNNWFENGLDTEGLTLIEVKPESVEYWKGRENKTIQF